MLVIKNGRIAWSCHGQFIVICNCNFMHHKMVFRWFVLILGNTQRQFCIRQHLKRHLYESFPTWAPVMWKIHWVSWYRDCWEVYSYKSAFLLILIHKDDWWVYVRDDLPKKECLLSGIAQISPPLPPIQATWTWSSFFGRQKWRIACMAEKDASFSDVKNKVLHIRQKRYLTEKSWR